MTIKSLNKDIQATNAIKKYRKSIGLSSKPRYAFSWWQSFLAVLTLFPEGISSLDARDVIREITGMKYSLIFANLLRNAADGTSPSPVRREYSKSLPYLAAFCKLSYEKVNPGMGRPYFLFKFKHCKSAKRILLGAYPELKALINIL